MHSPSPDTPVDAVYVEDDDDSRELIAEILGSEGFVVRAFATAEEALHEVRRAPPDVVLTDLRLGPGMGGEELARRVKVAHPEGPVVVALTGDGGARHLVDSPFDLVMIKPFDEVALVGAIRRLLSRDHPRREHRKPDCEVPCKR